MKPPPAASTPVSIDVGRVETGLWCDRCLLPSGYRAELLTLGTHGVAVIGTIARCDNGEGHPLRLPGDLA